MNLKKILKTSLFLILLTSLSACGFKVVNKSNLSGFSILELTYEGEKKINYNLRNKILFVSSAKNQNKIKLNLNTDKKKRIKEKNIKNEVTKYQITILTIIEIEFIGNRKPEVFKVSKTGDYNVHEQYSQTLNKEKKLINILTEKIAEDILEELSLILDAV
tara:strand:- start:120 stop:602 length:483 start_codon:yes stop_codon:yes gene_type:complete